MSVTIKYLGHSTLLISGPDGRKLLIDPWVANNPACPEQHKAIDSLDVMLITHAHGDHFQDAIEIAKAHKPRIACIFEIAAYLENRGVERIQPMNKGGTQQVGSLRVTMTDARHSSSIIEDGGKIWDGGEPAGYVIEFPNGLKIYHAGDTCVFPGMSIIAELYQPDLVILPIGDVFTMGPKEAAYACRLLNATKVIPIHYATFPLLTGTPEELTRRLSGQRVEVLALKPGESYRLQ